MSDAGLKPRAIRTGNTAEQGPKTRQKNTREQNDRATLARRMVSMAYELLLVFGVLVVALLLPHVLIGALLHRTASAPILWAHLFLVLLVYFSWFWCNGGQTLAMKTWHIRMVNESGARVRPVQAVLRYLLCWVSFGAAGVGLAWALVDRDKQFLHDRLAGTRLIRS